MAGFGCQAARGLGCGNESDLSVFPFSGRRGRILADFVGRGGFCRVAPGALAETLHYRVVTRGVVEARLGRYGGKGPATGRDAQGNVHGSGIAAQGSLTEQTVKGSKLPNVICTLPGFGPARPILVGAHYDHISDGDGVVDNWSGASAACRRCMRPSKAVPAAPYLYLHWVHG